jgi:hypothetical protein
MGLAIHYSGRLAKPELLPKLVEELEDIVKVKGWDYHIFEREYPQQKFISDEYHDNLYGISFSPPRSEPVAFTFHGNGRMSFALQMNNFLHSDDPEEREYLYMLFTKTQFAGPEIHMEIIAIFRYISAKYLEDFTLVDEGLYWETGDEAQLRQKMGFLEKMINNMETALNFFPKKEGENTEDFVVRIARKVILKNKREEELGKQTDSADDKEEEK